MSIFTRFVSDMAAALFGGAAAPSTDPYEPTVEDVLTVKEELIKTCGLPIELVDTVIDFAEYWPHTSVRRGAAQGASYRIRSHVMENEFLLRSYPLGYVPKDNDPTHVGMKEMQYPTISPRPWFEDESAPKAITEGLLAEWSQKIRSSEMSPCRKIVFTIRSHDQGWGGGPGQRGTYNGSYTWFDVGKETLCAFDDRNLPPSIIIKNESSRSSDAGHVSEDDSNHSDESDDSNRSDDGDEVVVNRMVEGIPKIQALPHFRLSATGEEVLEGADPEPIVCITRTVIPEIKSYEEGLNRGRYYFDHPFLPDDQCLQKNITAEKEFKEYKITWSCQDNIDCDSVEGVALSKFGRGRMTASGEFVRNLKIGDVITIWGKARFPGWENVVEEVGIDIYWAV